MMPRYYLDNHPYLPAKDIKDQKYVQCNKVQYKTVQYSVFQYSTVELHECQCSVI